MAETRDAFDEAVESDAHGTATEIQKAIVRKPENVQRWYATLIRIKTDLEGKIAGINAQMQTKKQEYLRRGPSAKDEWFQLKANLDERRASHNRARVRVEERIREAKLALQSSGQDPDHLKNRAKFLEGEVERLTLENAALKQRIRELEAK